MSESGKPQDVGYALKWAASQEAVTFPWLSAHSIRKGIGGDIYIVNPAARLSRTSWDNEKGHLGHTGRAANIAKILASIIDTIVLMMLALMVL
jgi:hypothetical protein